MTNKALEIVCFHCYAQQEGNNVMVTAFSAEELVSLDWFGSRAHNITKQVATALRLLME